MQAITVVSLFDGISVGQLALHLAGIPIDKYIAFEINKDSIKVTQCHYPATIQCGDVRNFYWESIGHCDLLLGGSPSYKKDYMMRRHQKSFHTIVFEDLKDKYNSSRYFNQTELERLQTLPDGYTKVLSRNKAAACIADSWTAEVIAHIFKFLKQELEKGEKEEW